MTRKRLPPVRERTEERVITRLREKIEKAFWKKVDAQTKNPKKLAAPDNSKWFQDETFEIGLPPDEEEA